ncbi:MAG: hypothetical protein A2086_13975 [Spirochaetes bacterium GWD1_27_9]|nr:MAG: hypothetical protein A2Z98_14905 [Spirochaetes bacterium GWB1_27_13]OHD38284.1 MAG: hypothetical protein A2086_13975 [Spirochaetes bacterium GWD1_27_9]
MNFFEKFGKGVKQVIGGMILGIFLLPVGVFMQKCAVDQMQYHKYFEKAVQVTGANDSKIADSTIIKTEGNYTLSDGSPYTVKVAEGDTYDGQYISYSVSKYIPKKEVREVEDSNGNKKKEVTFKWEKEGDPVQIAPDNLTVGVNDFSVRFGDFAQKYIPTATKVFKYVPGMSRETTRSSLGNEMGVSLLGKFNSMPDKPTDQDIYDGVYLKVLDGYVYNPNDNTMTISGIANKGSNSLAPVIGKWGAKMLVVCYGGLADTFTQLKSSANTERLMKFIIGSLCFMFGFAGIFGPILKVLDFIPIIGDLAIGLIYFVLAIVSLLLSVLFYVFFQFYWLLLAIAIIVPLALFFINKSKQKAA